MGVYIKGMEMPKSCIECKLLNWRPRKKHYRCPLTNEKIDDDTELSWGYMSKDCPLIEAVESYTFTYITEETTISPEKFYEVVRNSGGRGR